MRGEPAREERAGGPTGHDVLTAGIGLAAFVLFVLSPWLVDTSGPDPFYKGPLIFPMIVLAMTALAALPSALRIVRGPRARLFRVDGHGFPRRAALLFLLLCLFPLGIGVVGVQASTFIFVMAGLLAVGRPPVQVFLIAVLMTIAIHLVFRSFLDIWFPAPSILMLVGA